jgi:hypothetical protein
MKKKLFLQSFICLLAVSCTVRELDVVAPAPTKEEAEDIVFYADLASSDPDTKVYLDEHIKILWDEEDLISIFNMSTLNQKFMFDGETGENSGTFHWVEDDYFGAGNDLDYICAIYPYQESATISNDGVLTLTLPAEQTYREDSFGKGANTMVSVTEGHHLKFKNVGGYLALKFYGENVSVASITLAGNNGEPLAGEATMTPVLGENPDIVMAPTAGKVITLKFDTPLALNADAENATIFWMVVPPTDFTQGFTLTVTDTNGDVFIKETGLHLNITRNGVLRIKAIEVDMGGDDLFLTDVAPVDVSPHKTELVEDDRTVTVTMPTVTDFSNLLFQYSLASDDDEKELKVLVNGIPLVNGETRIDASGEETYVVVHDGHHGKRYQLTAKNTGLPVVRINTKGLFTLDELEAYLNALQNNGVDQRVWLPEADKTFVTVRIEDFDGTPGMKTKDGDPIYETDTKIKGRGNYSWKWQKKPYALKFDNKTTVLGMPAHKRWVLLANWRDRTLLRNDATFWLAKKATDELPYTTRGQFVELEFNGEYRGNYYLCEQIKIDENRVNINEFKEKSGDPTGGFLMEIDSYFDEVNKFLSEPFGLRYMFKEPDEDADALEAAGNVEIANNYRAAYSWMRTHINEFETVLKTKSAVEAKEYENYLDVNSAIMFMLLNELVANGDFFQTSNDEVFGPHSTYLYKDKGENAKIYMGPVWDFDYLTFTSCRSWRGFKSNQYYYYYMLHNQDFVDQVKYLWSKYKTIFEGLTDYIDDMARKLSLSQKFDEGRWPYATNQANRNDNKDFYENGQVVPYLTAVGRMKTYFEARIDWMNTQITNLETTNPSGRYRNGQWVAGEWLYP